MKKYNILITGGGAPGIAGTVYSVKNNPDNTFFRIIVTDIQETVVGKYLGNSFYQVPPPESTAYLKTIKKILTKEKVHAILPQTTREIEILSREKSHIESMGVKVIVSGYENLTIANDKYLLLQAAKKINIPYPRYILTDSESSLTKAVRKLGYPESKVVVKPRVSNGMRGVRIISEEKLNVSAFLQKKPDGSVIPLHELIEILRRGNWPELLVTEYLPGDEYTVDVFRNRSKIIVIPRVRKSIRSGITFNALVDLRRDIITYTKALSEALDLYYCFGFQYKLTQSDVPSLLECNPRVQGTMVASVFAGCNIIYLALCDALDIKVSYDNYRVKDNVAFQRYWGGIAYDDDGFIGRV